MTGLFCKKEVNHYYVSAKCSNCLPTPQGYGISVKVPRGISIQNFFIDKERTCPECGLKNTIERYEK